MFKDNRSIQQIVVKLREDYPERYITSDDVHNIAKRDRAPDLIEVQRVIEEQYGAEVNLQLYKITLMNN